MSPSTPHYLLFSESDPAQGAWKFVLRSTADPKVLEVADQEPGTQGERLELLTVVRGLEALDQPSKVTLMTPSKYIREGIRYGLAEWEANGWRWEFFGEMVPVKNRDLWQRIERAMRFHQVDCRMWRFDPPHRDHPEEGEGQHASVPLDGTGGEESPPETSVESGPSMESASGRLRHLRRWGGDMLVRIAGWRDALARRCRTLVPREWFG